MKIQEYFALFNQQELAKKHGVSQAMISKWANGVPVSGETVLKFCCDTNWQVTPHELRPDLYPHPEDGLPASLRQSLPVVHAGCSDVHGHLRNPPTSPHNA